MMHIVCPESSMVGKSFRLLHRGWNHDSVPICESTLSCFCNLNRRDLQWRESPIGDNLRKGNDYEASVSHRHSLSLPDVHRTDAFHHECGPDV